MHAERAEQLKQPVQISQQLIEQIKPDDLLVQVATYN